MGFPNEDEMTNIGQSFKISGRPSSNKSLFLLGNKLKVDFAASV